MKKSRPKTEWETAVPFATEICMSMYELYMYMYMYLYIYIYMDVCTCMYEFNWVLRF